MLEPKQDKRIEENLRVEELKRKSPSRDHEQYVMEGFTVLLSGRLCATGDLVFINPFFCNKNQKPNIYIHGYSWIYIEWYNNIRYWVLFDKISLERKISNRLASGLRIKKRYIVSIVVHIDSVYRPEETIIKLINLRTNDILYTTIKDLSEFFKSSGKKISKDFWSVLPRMEYSQVKRFYKWKHNKKAFDERRFCIGLELEKVAFHGKLREKYRQYRNSNSNKKFK